MPTHTPTYTTFLLLIVPAQLLSVVGEVFGQRITRTRHRHSNFRFLFATVVFSSVQAGVVLTATTLFLPHSVTDGQGTLSLLPDLIAHPLLWANAANNTVYWVAQAYLLREPWGVLIIVIGFLTSTFVLPPVQALFGMPMSKGLALLPTLLGYFGALACIYEAPPWVWTHVLAWLGLSRAASRSLARARTSHSLSHDSGWAPLLDVQPEQPEQPERLDGSLHLDGSQSAGSSLPSGAVNDVANVNGDLENGDLENANANANANNGDVDDSAGAHVTGPLGSRAPFAAIAAAWMVLVATTAVGIVITTYFEARIGMNMFGYAAADQILLPVTTLPAIALLNAIPRARAVFEPPEAPQLSFAGLAAAAWSETCLWEMLMFRGLMFGREFLFFAIATSYTLNAVYLEMTLARCVLSFAASLIACKYAAAWIDLAPYEAARTLHPANMTLRSAGAAFVLASLVMYNTQYS